MGKKKKRGSKSSILPMLAIGIGIYLITRAKKPPVIIIPPLPTGDGPIIQRMRPRLRMPAYM